MVFLEIPNVPLGTVFAEIVTIMYGNYSYQHYDNAHLTMINLIMYYIRQIFRGEKLLRLERKMVIRGKTFTVTCLCTYIANLHCHRFSEQVQKP